jgi:dihydrofolate reductase
MTFSLIAGIGRNNELGKDNQLLWKLPADMKHFRDTTSGHAVVMGRKTFESIGHALPNRRNIVITRDLNYTHEGVEVVHSIAEAIALFSESDEEVFNIGGAEIYRLALPYTDKLYMTHIDADFDADTFFPTIDSSWRKISEQKYPADENNPHAMTFVTYDKTA